MRQPQVVNIQQESVLAFDGENVIDDTTQLIITSIPTIQVDVIFVDLVDGSSSDTAVNVTMTYVVVPPGVYAGWWTIDIADILASVTLIDRHKYVATVRRSSGDTSNMREFKVHEFTIDNDSFEDTMMRLPFQVEIAGGFAWIRWYEDITFTAPPLFQAEAYQGGVGATPATRSDKVTHRGPIVKVL